MLPWVRAVFKTIHHILELARKEISAGGTPPDKPLTPATKTGNGSSNGNGSHKSNAMNVAAIIQKTTLPEKRSLLEDLLREIHAKGIVIQDIERGLIDFPAFRDSEEVLLCYEISDGDRIQYWHGLDDGFAGRQPIEETEFQ